MEIRDKIRSAMDRYGQTVHLIDDEWVSTPFKAFIQSVRYKNKMYLKDVNTPLGVANQDYFLFIGPYDHHLNALHADVVVQQGENKYVVVKSESVKFGDKVCYVWAIMQRLWEDV